MDVKAVIDTNIWVSSLLNPYGFPIKGQTSFLVTRDDDIKFDKPVSSFLLKCGVTVVSVSKFLAFMNRD